jgi:hypothetical protein
VGGGERELAVTVRDEQRNLYRKERAWESKKDYQQAAYIYVTVSVNNDPGPDPVLLVNQVYDDQGCGSAFISSGSGSSILG